MHMLRTLPLLAALPLFVAACGPPGGIRNPASDGGAPVSIGTTTTAHFGTILVGKSGMPLYTRAGDSAAMSTCTGDCATAWPPLTVPNGQQAVGGPGVDGTFGTLTRPDGTLQATYDDRPLYFSLGDKSSGDVSGNGVDGFSVATP
jgi:predicted lipoprotein with Yx(FWY)xxD motif